MLVLKERNPSDTKGGTMPANIAHMLIAHKALQQLKRRGVPEYAEFAERLDRNRPPGATAPEAGSPKSYVNLGSMGPDLYYYTSLGRAARDMLVDGFVKARPTTPWSYHLHALTPNRFPLRLTEVLFSDVDRRESVVIDDTDICKLAYIAGHLTHIAADQIIHPLVNRVAGPYYRDGANRKKHRTCEVFQDYYLYQEVYRIENKSGPAYDFFEQDFRGWADLIGGLTARNTPDWFRYFLQRGFIQTYGNAPPEDDIEDAVDNLLLVLRSCKRVGPYRDAAEAYETDGEDSNSFIEYVKNIEYLRFYRVAVELAVVYLVALYEVYARLREAEDFTKKHRERFLSIVSGADLTAPLERHILRKATHALESRSKMDTFLKRTALANLQNLALVSEKTILEAQTDAVIA